MEQVAGLRGIFIDIKPSSYRQLCESCGRELPKGKARIKVIKKAKRTKKYRKVTYIYYHPACLMRDIRDTISRY